MSNSEPDPKHKCNKIKPSVWKLQKASSKVAKSDDSMRLNATSGTTMSVWAQMLTKQPRSTLHALDHAHEGPDMLLYLYSK